MSVAASVEVVHVSFDERIQFGSPYPRGIALAWGLITGDATGGIIQLTINAISGFLYRVEHVHLQVNVTPALTDTPSIEWVHGWARERSGLTGGNVFSVVHQLASIVGTGNSGHFPGAADMVNMRRFPVGRTDLSVLGGQVIAEFKHPNNVLNVGYAFSVVLTYWPLEATYKAGFLSSFYEAPVVPPST